MVWPTLGSRTAKEQNRTDRPGLTSMQHAVSHTTAVQPSSHNQRHVLIGKQRYQRPELIALLHNCRNKLYNKSTTYVGCQRDTACVCCIAPCCGATAAERRPCSNRSISPASRAHRSKPAASTCGKQMMDRRTPDRCIDLLCSVS